MSVANSVFVQNLGAEFDIGNILSNKIKLKIGAGLSQLPDGTIVASSTQVARFPISIQTIINTGATWNKIKMGANSIDTIGISYGGNQLKIPQGVYEFNLVINFFDNNSPRQSHRLRVMEGATNWQNSTQSGMNYMRGASGADDSSITYSDLGRWSASGTFSFELQSQSGNFNTSNITGGWLTIKKIA